MFKPSFPGPTAILTDKARRLLLFCQNLTDDKTRRMSDIQHDRFKLWIQNNGVFQPTHNSLDYHLRTVESVRVALNGNLEILCMQILSLLSGGREVTEDDDLSCFEDDSERQVETLALKLLMEPGSGTSEAQLTAVGAVKDAITTLHELSLSIRKAIGRNSLFKTGKLLDNDYGFTWHKIQVPESPGILVEAVQFDTSASFQDYVSRLLNFRWLASPQQGYHLCAHLAEYRQALLNRCVKAISARRRQLVYFRTQQANIEGSAPRQSRPGQNVWALQDIGRKPAEHADHQMLVTSHVSKLPAALMSPLLSGTVPSDVESSDSRLSPPTIGDITSITSSEGGALRTTGAFEIPSAPELGSEEREKMCPYCCLVMPAETFDKNRNSRQWRRHLLDDLQPFICLHKDCPTPEKTYYNFEIWKRHLEQPHQQDWSCCSNCSQNKAHTGSVEIPSDPLHFTQRCFVCLEAFSGPLALWKHVAIHLQSAFLISLPWRDDIKETDGIINDKLITTAPTERIQQLEKIELNTVLEDDEHGDAGLWTFAEGTHESSSKLSTAMFDSGLSEIKSQAASSQHVEDQLRVWLTDTGITSV